MGVNRLNPVQKATYLENQKLEKKLRMYSNC